MKRDELERLIVDASDGVLTTSEIEKLETELQHHPDLYRDYKAIMGLPDFTNVYQVDFGRERYKPAIKKIRHHIRDLSYRPDTFEMVTLNWFRRYALAASIVIFSITSVFSLIRSQDEQTESEEVVEELFYPVDENSVADSYVLYLEEFTEE